MDTSWIWIVGGALLVLICVVDLLNTMVIRSTSPSLAWPTNFLMRTHWPVWRAIGLREPNDRRREKILGLFPSLVIFSLTPFWIGGQVVGWACIWTGLHSHSGLSGAFGDLFYFSGSVLFTIGFGDIVPDGTALRVLVIVEAFLGVGTFAIVISYLPTFLQYQVSRDIQLPLLDPNAERGDQLAAMLDRYCRNGDLDRLDDYFEGWITWMASIDLSHAALPLLAFHRFKRRDEFWLTTLGTVADAATILLACIPESEGRGPRFVHDNAASTLEDVRERLGLSKYDGGRELSVIPFRIVYDVLEAGSGFELRPFGDAWDKMCRMRPAYGANYDALSDYLCAPAGVWPRRTEKELKAEKHRTGTAGDTFERDPTDG